LFDTNVGSLGTRLVKQADPSCLTWHLGLTLGFGLVAAALLP